MGGKSYMLSPDKEQKGKNQKSKSEPRVAVIVHQLYNAETMCPVGGVGMQSIGPKSEWAQT